MEDRALIKKDHYIKALLILEQLDLQIRQEIELSKINKDKELLKGLDLVDKIISANLTTKSLAPLCL
ncbi:hypothetical protein LCER1_G008361 [Lachnellula cervina]|uniref:Uncharacterized protein n=1 Tax=Lachnellula cervina TaxID=1316786 RepID=A0A7D8UVX7_9HELO|nr:hypothetical protein LCER1_G008361 [Lachnellula cervina]